MLTPAEHARADAFERWLRGDHQANHPPVQLVFFPANAGIIAPRKEWGRAAQTADPVSTPTFDRSSYE